MELALFNSVLFSLSVMSNSLWPHGLQHARPPCPSPTLRVYSNSCPLCWWCHPAISSSVVPSSSTFNLSQHQGLFKWVSSLHQVAKCWSFSISPSNEYSGLISFRIDWLDILVDQGNLEPSPAPQFKSINSSVLTKIQNHVGTLISDSSPPELQ